MDRAALLPDDQRTHRRARTHGDRHGLPRRRRDPAARSPRPTTTSSSPRATCTRRTGSGRWTSAGMSPPAASPSCSASRRSPPTPSSAPSTGAGSPSRSTRCSIDLARVLRRVRRGRERLPRAQRDGATSRSSTPCSGLQNPGYTPEPWTPVDSIAWLKAMAWDLRSNLVDEIDRALLAAELAARGGRPPASPVRVGLMPTIVEGVPPAAAPAAATARSRRPAETPTLPASDPRDHRGRRGAAGLAQPLLDGVPELLGPEGGDLGSNSWVVSAPHRVGPAAARRTIRTSAPRCRPSGRRWGCTARSSATTAASTSAATRSRGCRASSSATTSASPGVHQPRSRRRRPLPRARRRRHLRARRRHGPSPCARRRSRSRRDPVTSRCARRPAGRSSPTSATTSPRSPRSTPRRRRARGRLRGLPAVDRADAGHHAAGGLRPEPRTGLERLPRCRLALRRARAEPHLRRRRRQHRLPGPGTDPRARPGDGTLPLPGWTSPNGWRAPSRSRSCRRCSTPRAAHRHGQQRGERRRPHADAGLGPRLPRRGIERLLGERIASGESSRPTTSPRSSSTPRTRTRTRSSR